jgi:nucleoside-diphosphate-sugar epimerase
MKCLVTGAAGFIGSHLCEQLLRATHTVVGLDAFIPYYPRTTKEANLAGFRTHPAFHFHPLDLRCDPLDEALSGVEAIFHLAAMPGLTRSWTDFDLYESCNLVGTQRLLEAARALRRCQRGPSRRMASPSWQPRTCAAPTPTSADCR